MQSKAYFNIAEGDLMVWAMLKVILVEIWPK